MPFFLRKAFKLGFLRFNLSKSGVGVSAGVTGARLGVRPDGRSYSYAGRFGLYHRQELGKIIGEKSTSPDITGKIKIEGIRAHLNIGFDRKQAKLMWAMAEEKGNTPEVKAELLEAVSESPKFWESLVTQDDWKETIENLWNSLFENLKEKGISF